MTFSDDFSELPNLEFEDKVQSIPVAQWAELANIGHRFSWKIESKYLYPRQISKKS